MTTCDGDLGAVAAQLEGLRGDLSEADRTALITERSSELMHRTPPLVTWQDFSWPAHCGDFCQFVEELGKPEVIELAGDTDPVTWFCARARDGTPDIWSMVRASSAREKPAENYDLTVYRFVCRECGESVLHWDCS
jgi:uncharacterized protein CbrC (UPF0167 family)